MLDNEWRLIYPAANGYDSASMHWGSWVPIFNVTTPVVGDSETEVADVPRARQDGVNFGVDFINGRTISFSIGITGDDPTSVRADETRLARAWRADAVRSTPGAVAELHAQYRGEERVAFGRPRRYTANLSEVTTNNFAMVTADFATSDSVWYSPGFSYYTIGIQAPALGGFSAPFKSPITTSATSDRSTRVVVNSELPVWPIITIKGGITNPVVGIKNLWYIRILGTFAEDDVIVIDTQPWARTITHANGVSIAGQMARNSVRLSQAYIPTGVYEIALSGTAQQNSVATADFRWRNTYTTL